MEKKTVKILCDTGASKSLTVSNILQFVPRNQHSCSRLTVSLHNVVLSSEWASGEVMLGVCPGFPFDGISFILDNDLASPLDPSDGH